MYKPKKSLGQNFLIDRNVAKKIIQCLDVSNERFLIEIGPGRGILTEFLISKTNKLILVEIDERSINFLRSKFSKDISYDVRYINEDILKVDLRSISLDLKVKEFDIIGNIPYYITGEIFQWLFKFHQYINSAVLTVQKEVALRVVANPGNKDYGILSIACQLYSVPKLEFHISAKSFFPVPKVDSSTIKLVFPKVPDSGDNEQIISIAKHCFNQRRKKLKNSIIRFLNLERVNPEEFYNFAGRLLNTSIFDKRAEELSINDYRKLFDVISMLRRKIDERET